MLETLDAGLVSVTAPNKHACKWNLEASLVEIAAGSYGELKAKMMSLYSWIKQTPGSLGVKSYGEIYLHKRGIFKRNFSYLSQYQRSVN